MHEDYIKDNMFKDNLYKSISFAEVFIDTIDDTYKVEQNYNIDLDNITNTVIDKFKNLSTANDAGDVKWNNNGPIPNDILQKELYKPVLSKDFKTLMSFEDDYDTVVTNSRFVYDIDSFSEYIDNITDTRDVITIASKMKDLIADTNKFNSKEYQTIQFSAEYTPKFYKFAKKNEVNLKNINGIQSNLDYPLPMTLFETSVHENIINNSYYITFTSQIPVFTQAAKMIFNSGDYDYYRVDDKSIKTYGDAVAYRNDAIRYNLITLLTLITTVKIDIVGDEFKITDKYTKFFGKLSGLEVMNKLKRNHINDLEAQANFKFDTSKPLTFDYIMEQSLKKQIAQNALNGEYENTGTMFHVNNNISTLLPGCIQEQFDKYLIDKEEPILINQANEFAKILTNSLELTSC